MTACCSAMPTSKVRSREAAAELAEAGRLAHRGGDRDEVVALLAEAHQLVAEHVGPRASGAGQRDAGLGVEPARLVHLVGLVVLGRRVAVPLAGHAVDDDRPVEAARQGERGLERLDVVPVDRAEVLQAEVLEHALRRDEVLDAALHAVQRVVDRRADDRRALERAAHPAEHLLVARAQPQLGQVVGQPADGRRVGPAVVVDDDDRPDGRRRRCCSAPPSTSRRSARRRRPPRRPDAARRGSAKALASPSA